jgi:hypothetical protein
MGDMEMESSYMGWLQNIHVQLLLSLAVTMRMNRTTLLCSCFESHCIEPVIEIDTTVSLLGAFIEINPTGTSGAEVQGLCNRLMRNNTLEVF